MAIAPICCPREPASDAIVAAAAKPTTTFFGLTEPSARPVPKDRPGRNSAIPSIHLGIAPSEPARGRPWNFRTAATSRYAPRPNFRTATQVECPDPGERSTASAIATSTTNMAATPTTKPTKKDEALTNGRLVKRRRMTGMTLIGEIVTTNARGSISPTTTFTASSLRTLLFSGRSPSDVGPRFFDDELGMPCPLGKRGAIQTGAHQRRHRLEGCLWISSDHLVKMTETGPFIRLVLPRSDRPVTRHHRLGDMTQVHEVAPVAELLRSL